MNEVVYLNLREKGDFTVHNGEYFLSTIILLFEYFYDVRDEKYSDIVDIFKNLDDFNFNKVELENLKSYISDAKNGKVEKIYKYDTKALFLILRLEDLSFAYENGTSKNPYKTYAFYNQIEKMFNKFIQNELELKL